MSAYPVMLDGGSLRALVVGGGRVATRKVRGLVEAGASVRVVAPEIDAELERGGNTKLRIERRAYAPEDIGDAMIVFAATSSRDVNARVGRDARARGCLVDVVDAPEEGTFTSPATHRAGDLVIAVSAGGVPRVAGRVRDCLASRFSTPYGSAVAELSELRARLLRADTRDEWARVSDAVIGSDFCETVERGELSARLASWR